MKIRDLNRCRQGANVRVSATVAWEDSDRPASNVWLETSAEFADWLVVSPNALLVAAILPAAEAGERRIAVDGEVCPRLVMGLETVLQLFRTWYADQRSIAIETPPWQGTSEPRPAGRAGAFFTGGVDSLAILLRNRELFPPSHPEYIRDAVVLHGINFESDDSPVTFAQALTGFSELSKSTDINLVPVYTNLRRVLNPHGVFFALKYHAALLAAAAHSLTGRLTAMSVASSGDHRYLPPWGSHPLVDPNFSSYGMRIYHDSLDWSRLTKVGFIARSETALQCIKVCTVNWPGQNCGTCEKCQRTILELLASGALGRSTAFGSAAVSEESIRSLHVTEGRECFYIDLIAPLTTAGRLDLVRGIQHLVARARGEVGVRGVVKRLDRLYCGGGLKTIAQRVRDASTPSHTPGTKAS